MASRSRDVNSCAPGVESWLGTPLCIPRAQSAGGPGDPMPITVSLVVSVFQKFLEFFFYSEKKGERE